MVPQPASIHSTTDQALDRTEELVERLHGSAGGRIQTMAAVINAETASDRLMRGLGEIVRRHGLMFNFHECAYFDYIEQAQRLWGVSAIQHLADLGLLGKQLRLVHMNHLTDTDMDLLVASDTRIVHCPGTAFRLAYGASTHGRFPEMLAAGLTVGLGTDGANAGDQLDLSRPIYLAAGLFKDSRRDPTLMPAESVLEMATLHGARSIGWQDDIGALEPGKKADLVILDCRRPELTPIINAASALVYATDGRSVDTVLVDGQVVVRGGHVVTVDEAEVYRQVAQLWPGLVARSGLPLQRKWPHLS
jgi:cytosine/adenosine deaminase-related metal-dependent hydrolase